MERAASAAGSGRIMQQYGELEVANDYLDDPKRLNESFERQGYLFFRGLLDTDEVGAVGADFMAELSGGRHPVS